MIRASLGARLIAFSATLSALMVAATFVALSLELRGHTRALISETLAQHQRMLAELHARRLGEIVRASSLMSDSPTLLAAMETYRVEAGAGASERADLLATIQIEVEKIAGGLAADLIVVTGPDGVVLARAGATEDLPDLGEDLSTRAVVRHALEQAGPVDRRNFSVIGIGERYYQAGCVPIELQGFIVGSLMLGEKIDQEYVARLGSSLGTDVLAAVDSEPLGSTLMEGDRHRAAAVAAAVARSAGEPGEASVIAVQGEDLVAVPLVIGRDDQGRVVTLHLIRSLSGALAGSNRSLLLTLAAYGLLVVVVTGLSAWIVSRSVLKPLESLVGFMRDRAATGGADSGRFEAPRQAGSEVRLLAETFNGLMDALQAHENRLIEKAREDLDRLDRLKESEKLAELGRMLAGAAHEINNPMTGVIGHLELLLQQALDEDVRRRLEEIRRQGHRVVTLTRNLLRVARRDEGQRAIVDIHAILRDTVALRQRDFDRAGLGIDLAIGPAPLRLTVSELELSQVFLNIVGNAYDALKEAGGRRTLSIRTVEGPESATIEFSDDGPGLKDPSRVFEYFYTTKPLGKGTGLGLGISKAIVEGHGGTIDAGNRPEGGARFTISLPRAQLATAAAGPAAAGEEEGAVRPQAQAAASRRPLPATVLIVDDEPVVRDLQLAILGSLGARAVAAPSASAAIDHLLRQDFDIIVADLVVDSADSGRAIYDWVRRHRRSGARGIVFVSGEAGEEADFLRQENLRCLRKPFEMEEYVRTLREAWDDIRMG